MINYLYLHEEIKNEFNYCFEHKVDWALGFGLGFGFWLLVLHGFVCVRRGKHGVLSSYSSVSELLSLSLRRSAQALMIWLRRGRFI